MSSIKRVLRPHLVTEREIDDEMDRDHLDIKKFTFGVLVYPIITPKQKRKGVGFSVGTTSIDDLVYWGERSPAVSDLHFLFRRRSEVEDFIALLIYAYEEAFDTTWERNVGVSDKPLYSSQAEDNDDEGA